MALQGLRERLDDVRGGIAAGSRPVLVESVAAVQDQLSLEHRQWLEAAESPRQAWRGSTKRFRAHFVVIGASINGRGPTAADEPMRALQEPTDWILTKPSPGIRS